ncbi:TlpA family protein disulfide reductase [Mesorhizobium microcysteis]|uniref:TlpA family protein disulfide reductase n=1 Tax=Neoaquamicrobium microcysteis TaxID=2682781 RepID=A0A5D4H3T9_9HYPH|nr:TlpA disulfide reductase family protein [Mesorhizobium microcysteis]TYR34962.1 TlpA family protein disulfide reductase [Mesorhizobium microcysteis]
MANGKFHLPTGRLIALAIVAGMTAGAIGVYVMGAPSGNNAQVAAAPDENAAACAAKAELAVTVGEAARGEVAAMMAASPPQSLTTLAFNAPDGAPMTVADLSGKTLLINLWATWCAPCRHEMPALNQLQKDMGSDAFEVVAVNVDTGGDEKPRAFLDETGVDALGYYRDSTLGLFNELKRRGLALGLPVTLLVDADGCLLANMNGPAEWASPDAKRLIEAAM